MSVNQPTIRQGTTDDAAELLEIYRPVVEETSISFELEVPSVEEFARRIAVSNEKHLWLVAEIDGVLAGYAYAGSHRARAAYGYSTEVSAYLHADFRGQGLGTALYKKLFEELEDYPYFHAYAGITMPNDASVGLHKSVGFSYVGTFENVGFKYNRWHDVSWWYRQLKPGLPS